MARRKLTWLPAAYADLEGIWSYIARDSAVYASGMIKRIVDAPKSLPRFPQLGRVVPEWESPQIRELIVGNYRLIYKIEVERIIVLAVIHGARLMPEEVRWRE